MRLDFAVVGQAGRRACTEDLCTAYEQVSGKTEIARTFSKALGQGAREAFEPLPSHAVTVPRGCCSRQACVPLRLGLMRSPVVMETSHAAQAHAAQHASVADALATAGSARDPVDLTCPR